MLAKTIGSKVHHGATPLVGRRFASTTQMFNPSSPTDGHVLKNSRGKISMPAFGFGTWGCEHFDNDTIAKAVEHALKVGYRHFDCARVYKNEKEIGEVFKDAISNGVCKREDLFITSKLYNNEHAPPDGGPTYALEDTLKNLQMDYVDAFLIHWPFRNVQNLPPLPFSAEMWSYTLKLMHELSMKGLTNSVGVCNATVTKLTEMHAFLRGAGFKPPAINQVELHPYLQQPKLIEYCNENNIVVTAAMPLGSPERPARFKRDDDPVVMNDPVISEIAKEVGCSPVQVIIRWHLQRGIVVIPKATENWMIEENFKTLKLSLTQEQMDRMESIDKHFRFARGEVFRWSENQKWETMWDYE